MTLWESVRIAMRMVTANPLRSALTMLGIVIGIAAVIAMVAIGSGAQQQVTNQIRSLGSNLVLVQPGSLNDGAVRLGAGRRVSLSQEDAAAIAQEVTGVVVAAPALAGQVHVVHANRNWSTFIGGVTPDYLIARDWRVERGREFTSAEVTAGAKVALIGTSLAAELFSGEEPIGATIRFGSVPFEVVGVLAEKGPSDAAGRDQDDVALVPLSTARLRLVGGSEVNRLAVHFILVKAASAEATTTLQDPIRMLLRQRHRLASAAADDFQLREPAAAMRAHVEATRSLTFLLAAVASVSLLVGGISIMNIMLVSVAERTREIGLRRAVGARKRDIKHQFLIEAMFLCLLGGIAGVCLGIGAAVALAKLAGWPVLVNPAAVIAAVSVAGAIGISFGFYPAMKASTLDPMDALRFE
jgi:putative ABC transport system permease protein